MDVKEKESFDAVIVATGHQRDAHIDIPKHCQSVNADSAGHWQVGRGYGLQLDRMCVENATGIWLQG